MLTRPLSRKASLSMTVTVSGIIMDSRLEQHSNVEAAIVSILQPSLKVTDLRLVQRSKAPLPMVVTDSGMEMLSSVLQRLNAPPPMDVSLEPSANVTSESCPQ